jgi:hypothetical protein
MYWGRRSGWGARPTAALLVLAAHGLFLMLLFIEKRNAPRPFPSASQLVAIPITLQPLPLLPERQPEPELEAPQGAIPPLARPPAPLPLTAITLAPLPSEPEQRATPELDGDTVEETAALAARRFEELDGPAPTFSALPEKMRQPCKPVRKSFKFKEDSTSKGGSASLTLGWEKQDPDKHLFDDMKAGRRTKSVPDPVTCD